MAEPLVSIVINCFNGEKFLAAALASVQAQTYRNWEVVFWDNQSTDGSARVVAERQDARIRYFRAPEHTLLYAARRLAIAETRGELIAFLDVDDWWEPDKLAAQVPLFEDPAVGLACTNYWVENEQTGRRRQFRRGALPSGHVLEEILRRYPVGMLTLMVRREAYLGLAQGFDARFHIIGDFDLVVRLALTWKLASVQRCLAHYRIHGANEGLRHKARHVDELRVWREEMRREPRLAGSPAFGALGDELTYMEGRLHLAGCRRREAGEALGRLGWNRYRLKLLLLLGASVFRG
jgi:glycosyltransferase involved in cell wall biosynthesis